MKRLALTAAVFALAGGVAVMTPTKEARADQNAVVQFCKYIVDNGYYPGNLGSCVSTLNKDVNSSCQQYYQYFYSSVGQCIRNTRSGNFE